MKKRQLLADRPPSELAHAMAHAARRPPREITLALDGPLLAAIAIVAEGAGLTIEAACLRILERTLDGVELAVFRPDGDEGRR